VATSSVAARPRATSKHRAVVSDKRIKNPPRTHTCLVGMRSEFVFGGSLLVVMATALAPLAAPVVAGAGCCEESDYGACIDSSLSLVARMQRTAA
jgi:hypothetical protein